MSKKINNTKIDNKLEIIGILVTLIIVIITPFFLQVRNDTAFFAGIIIVLLFYYTILIKQHLHNEIVKTKKEFYDGADLANTMSQKLAHMQKSNLIHAKKILDIAHKQIKNIEKGIIPLSEIEYFRKVIDESRKLKSRDTVLSVNTFDERRFIDDPRQRIYLEENINAVENFNINFQRIFVINSRLLLQEDDIGKERISAICNNIDNGITVILVEKKRLLGCNDLLKDWVLFNREVPKLFIDYQDEGDKTRVHNGELIINNTKINDFRKNFSSLKNYAMSYTEMNKLLGRTK